MIIGQADPPQKNLLYLCSYSPVSRNFLAKLGLEFKYNYIFLKFLFQVLSELIETEQKYVKDLQFLLAAYLEPLRKEHFWNYSDLEQLYKNVKEIFAFQTKFLRILEESLESDPGFGSHSDLEEFKV